MKPALKARLVARAHAAAIIELTANSTIENEELRLYLEQGASHKDIVDNLALCFLKQAARTYERNLMRR